MLQPDRAQTGHVKGGNGERVSDHAGCSQVAAARRDACDAKKVLNSKSCDDSTEKTCELL